MEKTRKAEHKAKAGGRMSAAGCSSSTFNGKMGC